MPVAGGGLRGGVEQEREGAGGHRADLVVVGDVDLVEERLVEQAAYGVGCLLVHGVAVAGEVEAVGQFGLCFGVVRAGSVEPAGDLCQRGGDAVLFGFELVERDGPGVGACMSLSRWMSKSCFCLVRSWVSRVAWAPRIANSSAIAPSSAVLVAGSSCTRE